jgi:hypothetical protein
MMEVFVPDMVLFVMKGKIYVDSETYNNCQLR